MLRENMEIKVCTNTDCSANYFNGYFFKAKKIFYFFVIFQYDKCLLGVSDIFSNPQRLATHQEKCGKA